jgi:hypothetical protein
MNARTLTRLFGFAITLAAAALASAIIFVWWLPAQLESSSILASLAVGIKGTGTLISIALGSSAMLVASYSLLRWHRWELGKGQRCSRCDGLVIDRMNRSRFFEECIHCGRRQ